MITDPLFYRLFVASPETFFLLLGTPPDEAIRLAARYEYAALEFKETAHRSDGVFSPKEPGLPVYFLEVQFYPRRNIFADLLAKAYTYLKQHDPDQLFCGVVLFATRSMEPKAGPSYEPLFDAALLRRFYLDEMPELAQAPLGLSILYLFRQAESELPPQGRELVARAKHEISDEALRADLVELIETVIMSRLPYLTREEVQAMLQIYDIRQSRVYQEALEEGRQEGRAEGAEQERQRVLEEKVQVIAKLAAKNMSPAEIADILGLDEAFVRQHVAPRGAKGRAGGKASRRKERGRG
jgi:predicted transposase/invertase (TIGR01784 family)